MSLSASDAENTRNRNSSQLLVLLYTLQHFTSGYVRQIPIQKNEIGERNTFVLFLEQNMKSLLAVYRNGKFPASLLPAIAKRLLDEV